MLVIGMVLIYRARPAPEPPMMRRWRFGVFVERDRMLDGPAEPVGDDTAVWPQPEHD